MMDVTTKQYTITGMDETFTSFAAFCAVRTDQIKPPTSASVCAGARMDVSMGCQAVFAVPKRFQPSPNGSEKAARM